MPQPASPGVKDPAGTPPAGTGASNTPGSPPDDDLRFEDDQIVEQDGKKMVPLDVVLGEREKWKRRVEESSRNAPPPPAEPAPPPEPDQPLFNWEKLVSPQAGGQSQPQPAGSQGGPPPMDPGEFQEKFRDMLNERPWDAVMWAMQTGMQYRDKMEGQARQFVPDYGNLPVHDVSDAEIQTIASNPYALRAMIAKAKYGRAGVGARNSAPAPVSAPAPAAPPVSQDAIKAAMELIMSMGRGAGTAGEGTGGPATPPPAGDQYELDKDSVSYLKARGYTDDQIREQAKKIVEIRRRRGQVV